MSIAMLTSSQCFVSTLEAKDLRQFCHPRNQIFEGIMAHNLHRPVWEALSKEYCLLYNIYMAI